MASRQAGTDAPGERQKFFFQFVTTPTSDTPGTTLLLHFNNRRYLFGHIAEGTQRACIQRGVGIKKVRNIFLTGPTSWDSMGGLVGMILTMADVQSEEIDSTTGKRPKLQILGGPKLTHSIACARRFVFRTGMPLEVCEADLNPNNLAKPCYTDDNIDVWSIPVKRRKRSRSSSPNPPNQRSQSPNTVGREQKLRAETVKNMFDSDWRKDRLVEHRFDEVKLPALIWTRNPDTKELSYTQCSSMSDAPHLQPDSKVLVRNPWPASLLEELPPADNIAGSVAMSYIVRGKPQRGRFMPEKARELGLKPGPHYAKLTAGGSVTLDDGTVITADMVLGQTEPGKGMVILDIPTVEYLEDLSNKIDDLRDSVMGGIETIAWLLGDGIFSNPAFTQVVTSLSGRQHIVSCRDLIPDYIALDSAAASMIRLAQIRPACFKVPVHHEKNAQSRDSMQDAEYSTAERGLIVQVAPKSLLVRTEVPSLLDIEATKASHTEVLKDLIPAPSQLNGSSGLFDNVQIVTLGTGSAVPSKYRNVSATLVRIPELGSYLFDCGENTMGMLRRTFTSDELDEVIADLRLVWISHLHADHHLGILSIIEAKRKVMQRLNRTDPKLYIISEPNMADFLNDYSSIQSSAHCELLGVLNSRFITKNKSASGNEVTISQTSLPIKEFLTTRVSHCQGAQACSVTFINGFKFSYSGDCRPSAHFAKIGRDSHVMLHEATFDDGLEGDAMAKKHSTTAEALAVAYAMKAKNVILTHFSQRYQKIPVLNRVKFGEVRFEEGNDAEEAGPIEDGASTRVVDQDSHHYTESEEKTQNSMTMLQKVAQEMNICVAFDLMSVTVGQIRDMYKYYPAIEKMFELEHEKSEAKKEARREINEKTREEKDIKEKKWKPAEGKKAAPTGRVSDNLYDRINRNKTKPSKESNDRAAHNTVDAPVEGGNTGQETTPSGTTQPPVSNRARKRQLRSQQAAEGASAAQNSSAHTAFISEIMHRSHDLMRQLSPEPEASDPKRPKLSG